MSSRKKGKGKRSTGPDMSSEQQSKTTKGDASSNGGDAVGKEKGKGKEEGEGGVDVEGRAGGLKAFVQQMEGSSYRVVEMRLALVGAFGVAFRILLFDDLKDQDQTSTSVVSFVAIGLVVLIFSTWLDYFPSKLSHLQLRDAKGQGMSFGCLLLPTLCCAGIHCALYSAPEVVDHHLPFPSLREWGIITGSVIATAILEAYTWQIDNLVLGLFQLAFFISFL